MSMLLVTGGGGFVMSHVVRQWLEQDPAHRAIVADAAPLDAIARRWFADKADRIEFRLGSVTDPGLWNDFPKTVEFIVHGAAVTSIDRLAADGAGMTGIVPAVETNIMGAAHALAFADGLTCLKGLICVSSGSVYADEGPVPLPEDEYVAPDGFYAVSKFGGELLTEQARRQFGLKAAAVRLSGVYGPMDRETPHRSVECVPMRIARAALNGKTLSVRHPDAVGDFIHAGCVARAILGLLSTGTFKHPIYNIAYGEALSYARLLSLFAERVPGFDWHAVDSADAGLVGDPTRRTARWGAYDIGRIQSETDWRPIPIGDAIDDYLAWLRTVS